MEVDHGADAENGDEVHVPLQDYQLEEEEEEDDDDDADDADVPVAAAGTQDASPGGVLPKLVASDYGTNSPTSKGARRTSITGKGTWFNIKRIKVKSEREVLGANSEGELRKVMSGHTHVCIICWRRMNVTRDWKRNGAFITTVPNAHNRKYHADAEGEDPDKCNMHQTDKIPRAMCGDLVRTRMDKGQPAV